MSGGCVEGAVYELAQEVVASGTPALQRYGVSDEDAYAVGLTCGGILDLWVEAVSRETFPQLGDLAADIDAGRPVAVATVVEHPDPARLGRRLVVHAEDDPVDGWVPDSPGDPSPSRGSLGSARLDAAVTDDARGLLALGHSETLTYGPDGERRGEGMRVFVDVHAPAARMLVFGAIDFAAACARDREVPRLHRHGLRRSTRLRHGQPLPRRRRGGRRVAAPLPLGRGRGGARRRPHGAVRPHPRPEVRRPAARGGATAAGGGVHRGDGVAAHPRRPAGPAARGRGHRGRARPALQPHRARPRGPDAGGDGGEHRRRDRRPALGRRRLAADRRRRAHPPRRPARASDPTPPHTPPDHSPTDRSGSAHEEQQDPRPAAAARTI